MRHLLAGLAAVSFGILMAISFVYPVVFGIIMVVIFFAIVMSAVYLMVYTLLDGHIK